MRVQADSPVDTEPVQGGDDLLGQPVVSEGSGPLTGTDGDEVDRVGVRVIEVVQATARAIDDRPVRLVDGGLLQCRCWWNQYGIGADEAMAVWGPRRRSCDLRVAAATEGRATLGGFSVYEGRRPES